MITRKLSNPVIIDDQRVTHVAFEPDEPETQAYGNSEQAARVAFLTQKGQKPKPAPKPAPPKPPEPTKPVR